MLSNLKIRRLGNDVVCPIYSEEEETMEHLFRDCEFPRKIQTIIEINMKPKEDFWRPSKAEQMKVNFNAIFFQQELKATTGIIIRNYEGLVMGSCTYPLGRTGDPTTMEAKACLQAIIFGEEMRFQDLVVEGDALTIF
ncbi:hypothetical protein Golob_022987 [Gossypium lobatum]|uniref:RNase H type-1 domain-containing protein n=1 Tax=Gossypium lobatum TaxID=34289 RepID=A0A7J8LIB9_9ROSI|nr:hypothetical protein [Gossypium lobatum]